MSEDLDREDTLLSSSSPSLGDSEDAQLLRELAYAPPRRLPHEVAPGTPWSESGRFLIEKPLGRGGMGTVYAARDTRLERTVAIKVLDAADPDRDAAHNARLLCEAKLAASFSHQRIAQIYDVDTHHGFGFVAMEYVEGGTLRQWMGARAPGAEPALRLGEVLALALQIAEGLATLHAKRIVHGDLKPENVMLDADGGIKLVDFGLARYAAAAAIPGAEAGAGGSGGAARSAEAGSERSQFTGGTPGYMAPEQYEGQHGDPRADVFALGVVICELVIGKRLLRAAAVPTSATTASSIAAGTPSGTAAEAFASIRQVSRNAAAQLQGTPWAELPAPMRALTQKMLACDPAERFADGAEALAALRAVQDLAPVPPHRSLRARTRRFAVPGIAAVLGLLWLGWAYGWGPFGDSTSASPPAIIPVGMVWIPGGQLTVGHSAEEIERECREIGPGCAEVQMRREIPSATIHVAPFFLDRDEVTNEEFITMLNTYTGTLVVRDDEDDHSPRFVVRNTGGDDVLYDLNPAKGGIDYVNRRTYELRPGREKFPAAQATWYGAKLYCESRGKRLPTEDEWEAAARGRDNRRFPWGDALPRCGEVNVPGDGQLGALGSCMTSMRAVGTSLQDVTPEGVRDLGGNSVEWTSSRYVEDDRTAHPTSGPADGPRVIRGGSWVESVMTRSSGRSKRPADFMGANLGFRCASDIPSTKPSP
jgi:serine/threonine protein kinase